MQINDLFIPLHENMNDLSQTIEEDGEFIGSIEGYEVSTDREQLRNWLQKYDKGELYETLSNKYDTIAIIKSIHVDDEHRGQGYGNELFEGFIGSTSARAVLLVADRYESQSEGFNLQKWYEGYGFKVISDTSSGPLMLLDQNTSAGHKDPVALYPKRTEPEPEKRKTSYYGPDEAFWDFPVPTK